MGRVMEGLQYPMQDIIFVIVTILFFAVAIAYVRGCERLK
jgi:hypothetical protein